MAIQLSNMKPGDKWIELGGGDNPHPQCQVNCDCRQGPKVHFTADFNAPLPITSDEWDGAFSHFVLEHISWRHIPGFLKEVLRILKPGGKIVFAVPNTYAQIQWLLSHMDGWDGRDLFESASGMFFGDNDYPENTHRAFFTPGIVQSLFAKAGFQNIITHAYGERDTDLVVEASKPALESTTREKQQIQSREKDLLVTTPDLQQEIDVAKGLLATEAGREQAFDKAYFNGGGKVGGYAREGMWDYPVHEVTARHILSHKPSSVLEIGCARGYILKRLQDAGVRGYGLEISKHCYLTRVANNITQWDICLTPWPSFLGGKEIDLLYSVAVLEHIPEQYLPAVIQEMAKVSHRCLHGVDFGSKDDGFDKTHCTLRSKEWWQDLFVENYRTEDNNECKPFEIVDKEELERGDFPAEVLAGDGRKKLNIGSFTTMVYHGWLNIDVHDLTAYANAYKYNYLRHDVRQGLPFATGVVDCIACCHMLEHINYKEGLSFLKECRRVIRPDGAMRIIVPDAAALMKMYWHDGVCVPSLQDMDEINEGCANAPTAAGKLWALLHEGHAACYDDTTLVKMLEEAGWYGLKMSFRDTDFRHHRRTQILHETLDMLPCLSLYMDAIPKVEK